MYIFNSISPGRLRGELVLPPSKSIFIRFALLAALCDDGVELVCGAVPEDCKSALKCVKALGAEVNETNGGFAIVPNAAQQGELFPVGESAALMRMLLPILMARGEGGTIERSGSLVSRPVLVECCEGCSIKEQGSKIILSGRARERHIYCDASLSSQPVSGWLMALAAMGGGELELAGEIKSAGYISMTLSCLEKFGISCEWRGNTISVEGRLRSPKSLVCPADMSAAVPFILMNRLGGNIRLANLTEECSSQPDYRVAALAEQIDSGASEPIDISGCPDLFPCLSIYAAGAGHPTVFKGAERLALKECDRAKGMRDMICALGGSAELYGDSFRTLGSGLVGGSCNTLHDHRLVMAAALATCIAREAVAIDDADCVSKSFPGFIDVFEAVRAVSC